MNKYEKIHALGKAIAAVGMAVATSEWNKADNKLRKLQLPYFPVSLAEAANAIYDFSGDIPLGSVVEKFLRESIAELDRLNKQGGW